MDYWYNEGLQAAWAEFQKGDRMPTVAELIENIKETCDVDDEDAAAFAAGWLRRAEEIEAR